MVEEYDDCYCQYCDEEFLYKIGEPMICPICLYEFIVEEPEPDTDNQPNEEGCPVCNGNDRERPCAYPSEGKPGCLRDCRVGFLTKEAAEEGLAAMGGDQPNEEG